MTKICKLCLKKKPLLKQSHILPDFLYKNLFDEKHKLRALDFNELVKEKPRISKPSTGDYEGDILCSNCDNKVINNYESYAADVIKNNRGHNQEILFESTVIDGMKSTKVRKLNYTKTKLFLTSLLWKSSIASRFPFRLVELGPYEEPLRSELFTGILANSSIFQINIIQFEKVDEFTSFIGQPVRHKYKNTTFYSIIIDGFMVIYYLKENDLSEKMVDYKLETSGDLVIPIMPKEDVKGFIFRYSGFK